MRIIPVLDILNAQVVHGVKGERNKYSPIHSVLSPSSNPLDIALALKRHFPITELYIADLDAIMHQHSSFSYLDNIIQQSALFIMIDAGIDTSISIQGLLKKGVTKVIVGTETLHSLNNLKKILQAIPPENLIVSLDLKYGKILTKAKDLSTVSPLEAVLCFERLGVLELIVLELTKVGSESGVRTNLLQNIIQNTSIPIITGGGARNIQDLRELKDAGIAGVLIATALHSGTITASDLSSL